MFIDQVKIFIKSGKGGDGAVSFRREKYVPNGGPDGGDGGKGGDIIFKIDKNMNTLSNFHQNQKYIAQNGESGKKNNMHGKNADNLIINVPAGTIIKNAATNKIMCDLSLYEEEKVVLAGGYGGKGNQH